jgi:hypothetical protein
VIRVQKETSLTNPTPGSWPEFEVPGGPDGAAKFCSLFDWTFDADCGCLGSMDYPNIKTRRRPTDGGIFGTGGQV